MGSYRVTAPISVMVKENGTAYVLHTIPQGEIISVKEIPIDLNRYVIVNWDGKDALMFARELIIRAERTSVR